MNIPKFTNQDRKLIISKLEEIQKTKLTPVKPSRKLFQDENDAYYLIFGGTGNWHGMHPSIIDELKKYNKEGVFVIAKKFETKIQICVGSLLTFIKNYNSLVKTKKGDLQFHITLTQDGLYVQQIPDLYCNLVEEIYHSKQNKKLDRLKNISKIINIDIEDDIELTHSDIQAKLILIGSYLGYRTFTPDKGKNSIYGNLGDLCSETEVPKDFLATEQIDKIKYIDVMWFDEEGFITHAFEVEHSTDITKGLLRLYQVHKLRIKMFIVAEETKKGKFEQELTKTPFRKIKNEYLFKNYQELDEFFNSVKNEFV